MKNFYQVSYKHIVEEEKMVGKDVKIIQKKKVGQIMVLASSPQEAADIADKELANLVDMNVTRVAKTNIKHYANKEGIKAQADAEI